MLFSLPWLAIALVRGLALLLLLFLLAAQRRSEVAKLQGRRRWARSGRRGEAGETETGSIMRNNRRQAGQHGKHRGRATHVENVVAVVVDMAVAGALAADDAAPSCCFLRRSRTSNSRARCSYSWSTACGRWGAGWAKVRESQTARRRIGGRAAQRAAAAVASRTSQALLLLLPRHLLQRVFRPIPRLAGACRGARLHMSAAPSCQKFLFDRRDLAVQLRHAASDPEERLVLAAQRRVQRRPVHTADASAVEPAVGPSPSPSAQHAVQLLDLGTARLHALPCVRKVALKVAGGQRGATAAARPHPADAATAKRGREGRGSPLRQRGEHWAAVGARAAQRTRRPPRARAPPPPPCPLEWRPCPAPPCAPAQPRGSRLCVRAGPPAPGGAESGEGPASPRARFATIGAVISFPSRACTGGEGEREGVWILQSALLTGVNASPSRTCATPRAPSTPGRC